MNLYVISYDEIKDAFKILNTIVLDIIYQKRVCDSRLNILRIASSNHIEYKVEFKSAYGKVVIKLNESKISVPFIFNLFKWKTITLYTLAYTGVDKIFNFSYLFDSISKQEFGTIDSISAAWREFYYYLITEYILYEIKKIGRREH